MALTLYYDTYQCTGDQPEQAGDLVLLHGWGMNSLVWDDVMPSLLNRFRVTVIDFPGLGRSPVPGGDYDLSYLIKHVLSVAPDKAVWMGWSLGGLVATQIALLHPRRVQGLINVCSSPSFVARENWLAAMPEAILEGFIAIFEEDYEGTLARFLALQAKGSVTIKSDIRRLKDMVYFHGLPARQALRGGLKILRDCDFRAQVSTITCPVAYILGSNDNLVPATVAESLADSHPSAQVSIIDGASHLPFLQCPEAFLDAFNDFCVDQLQA
ncbi:MAG: pimeloyl-[acyl-carrier protein] methyl ester esterase [Gammaproteobacteria bacterium]|nr:MAG: pimeloyl-[acyl-carrier protein] methyl ester esterase [Gammaproteobacteria bacterium]